MIDKELELYYRNFKRMFASDGWKQLQEDLTNNAVMVNSVELTKDNDDLRFRKGQLAVIATLLNLESQLDTAEQDAIESAEEEAI
jgi:hypothetical protein|tara:strand:+ start:665 stop:919 length:255 start_codon:yes stop_codon:yes gene_type:complete